MKSIKIISILSFVILSFFTNIKAQEAQKYSLDFGSDIVSNYVWRGGYFSGASMQPTISFTKGNFIIGTFGSYSFSETQDLLEADIFITYKINKHIGFTINDYFFNTKKKGRNHYFDYDKNSTGHTFEATLSLDGADKLPFSFLVATNFYGADTKKTNGDITYSTYVELAYNKNLNNTDFSAFIGASINTPGDDIVGFYLNKEPGIVNIGIKVSKKIEITDKFSLPVYASLVTNPETGNIYVIFGITL